MHGDGFADNEAICNEFADGLAGVGIADFVDLVRIKPDLALSTTNDRGRKTLLSSEIDPLNQMLAVALHSSKFLLWQVEKGIVGSLLMGLIDNLKVEGKIQIE